MKLYSIEYVGIDHPQYWQGASVAYTDWEHVYTGIGSTPREAAEDACEMAEQDGRDSANISTKKFSESVPRELRRYWKEAGDGECEMQCYVLLWMRSPDFKTPEATVTRVRINASVKAYVDAYGKQSLG